MDETRGKTYTARDIADAVAVYADYHHVSTDVVDVTRVYSGNDVVGFRLLISRLTP